MLMSSSAHFSEKEAEGAVGAQTDADALSGMHTIALFCKQRFSIKEALFKKLKEWLFFIFPIGGLCMLRCAACPHINFAYTHNLFIAEGDMCVPQ